MNGPAVFELFVRQLPPHRDWLLAAGIGPALSMVERLRFGDEELRYLRPSLLGLRLRRHLTAPGAATTDGMVSGAPSRRLPSSY